MVKQVNGWQENYDGEVYDTREEAEKAELWYHQVGKVVAFAMGTVTGALVLSLIQILSR